MLILPFFIAKSPIQLGCVCRMDVPSNDAVFWCWFTSFGNCHFVSFLLCLPFIVSKMHCQIELRNETETEIVLIFMCLHRFQIHVNIFQCVLIAYWLQFINYYNIHPLMVFSKEIFSYKTFFFTRFVVNDMKIGVFFLVLIVSYCEWEPNVVFRTQFFFLHSA